MYTRGSRRRYRRLYMSSNEREMSNNNRGEGQISRTYNGLRGTWINQPLAPRSGKKKKEETDVSVAVVIEEVVGLEPFRDTLFPPSFPSLSRDEWNVNVKGLRTSEILLRFRPRLDTLLPGCQLGPVMPFPPLFFRHVTWNSLSLFHSFHPSSSRSPRCIVQQNFSRTSEEVKGFNGNERVIEDKRNVRNWK